MDRGGESVLGGSTVSTDLEVHERRVYLGNYQQFSLAGGKRGEVVWWRGRLAGTGHTGEGDGTPEGCGGFNQEGSIVRLV